MDKGKDELSILAPIEAKPRLDRIARNAQQAARAQGLRFSRREALGLGGLVLLMAGCGGSTGGDGGGSGTGTGAASGGLAGKPLEDRLLIYNFSEYLDPRTIEGFEKANGGTSVKETYYASADEMAAKIKAGGGDYDIIVPGQDSLASLGGAGHLLELDHELLPNMANLQAEWRDLEFDPGNRFSIVKNWGYVGFYFRNDLIDADPRTWLDFFELLPEAASKGRTNMLEGTTLTVGCAMIANGVDPDSEDQGDYDDAVTFLTRYAKDIKTLDAATYNADSRAGKIVLGQAWSGDLVQIAEARRDITAVAPEGPSERFADSWCIPADAPHPVAAHAWINHLMDPRVALTEMQYSGYGTANAKTWELPGAQKFRDDPLINLDESKLSQYRFIVSPTPGVLRMRQTAYEQFRATR